MRGPHELVVGGLGALAPATELHLSGATNILREFAAGVRSVSHTALDELPDGKQVEHLRSVLVSLGTLPPRDEQMVRLERWITRSSPNDLIPINSTCCAATASGI